MAYQFYIRKVKSGAPVSITMRVMKNHTDEWFTLPLTILPAMWDSKNHRPKAGRTEEEYNENLELTNKLKAIEYTVDNFIDACGRIGRRYTRDDIQAIILRASSGKVNIEADTAGRVPTDILAYIDFLIASMENGSLLFASRPYERSTIRAWKVFRNVYANFSEDYELGKGRVVCWDSLDKSVYDAFISFCRDHGFMVSSINKMIIDFKTVVTYAHDYHALHSNTEVLRFFSLLKVSEEDAQTKIYLTDAEIQSLYEMPLPPGSLADRVRDVFLLGCYTGQRVSDYARLSGENFTVTTRGTPIVKLRQIKTGNTVVVPILNGNLMALANKYDREFPEISDVIINRYMKRICRDLSETVPSLAEKVTTVLTLRETRMEAASLRRGEGLLFERNARGRVVKPRYEMVMTHTARRSMITNLYKTGRFSVLQMMSISGHKTEKHFWTYLSQSSNEIADEIADIQKGYEEETKNSNIGLF